MNEQSAIIPIPPVKKERRPITTAEKLLLPVALLVAVLYDRLAFAPIFDRFSYVNELSGVFWLCYLVIFYVFYWKRLRKNRVLWFTAGCSAALCAWNFFFTRDDNAQFTALTYLVIPAVLMAHAQFAAGDYKLKDAGRIAAAWVFGWLVKPFSGILAFAEATGSLVSGDSKTTAKKAMLGVAVTLPLLCVIVPLLSGADRMFGYYLRQIAGNWDFASLALHTFVVALAVMLFYSFLWNIGYGVKEKEKAAEKAAIRIDMIICRIVLGSVTLLYVLFLAVQFTYLFAGAGLPPDMTYSEYAREGFAQTVAVCAINLVIFGAFLEYGIKEKSVRALLAGLLALTGVMLFSGFVRLRLYIEAYGLTWLRVLSAWFVIYLAAVVVLCAVRMAREKLPAIAMSALILLEWYVALGYANPDAMVRRYNHSHNYETTQVR